MKRAAIAWLALVVPLWIGFVLCTSWEPLMRDSWGHYFWHRENDLSPGTVWFFVKDTYLHGNPRLGQLFTMVQHAPGPWHSIITPLLELSLFYLLATLMLGRWPSLRRAEDALLTATVIAMAFATVRSLGPMLFYRPFSGNYVFGLVMNLLWLVPYRLHAEQPLRRPALWIVPMLVLGFASGMCNEHTGVTFLLAGLFALVVYWRRGERIVPWAWSGLAGMLAGTITLLTAPGQDLRYAGLASKQSTWDLIALRGAYDNARIVLALAPFLVPLLLWIVPGIVARVRPVSSARPRSQLVAELVAVVMALLILITLIASPKQGDRLYFASTCLLCAAFASWFCARLGRIERWYGIALATAVIGVVGYRLVSTYHRAGEEFDARLAAITQAAPGSIVRVAPYSQPRSRYVLGDDFLVDTARANIAFGFKLAGIELEQQTPTPQREPTTPPPADP